MKIYLIGMPGSGKTTLAKQVAAEMNLRFVDLDQEIENQEQKSIGEIFSQNGEDHFRKLEAEMLRKWASSSESFVMSTGGGTPCHFNGIDAINQSGISVYLDVPLPELVKRVSKKTGRPLLDNSPDNLEMKLKAMKDERLWYYSQAHVTLTNASVQSFLKALQFNK